MELDLAKELDQMAAKHRLSAAQPAWVSRERWLQLIRVSVRDTKRTRSIAVAMSANDPKRSLSELRP